MVRACARCGLLHPATVPCPTFDLQQARPVGALAPGTMLAGRYRIHGVVGRGGNSLVYRAGDSLLPGRRAAIKQLHLAPGATPQERAEAENWFAREAALLSGLRNPRIPALYGVFRDEGQFYLAQEFIEGRNLDELVRRRGPLDQQRVLVWAAVLCELLRYLHALPEPVIFRDLKPANILLRPNGELVVVDFGIARPYRPGTVGTIIGTPGYAPPEQYQGLATPQSDVYALGATLHRLLTGHDPEQGPPFTFPPVRALNPRISPHVAAAVERAVCLDLAARYPDVASFEAELLEPAARWWSARTALRIGQRDAATVQHAAASSPAWTRAARPLRLGILGLSLILSGAAIGALQAASAPTPATPAMVVSGVLAPASLSGPLGVTTWPPLYPATQPSFAEGVIGGRDGDEEPWYQGYVPVAGPWQNPADLAPVIAPDGDVLPPAGPDAGFWPPDHGMAP